MGRTAVILVSSMFPCLPIFFSNKDVTTIQAILLYPHNIETLSILYLLKKCTNKFLNFLIFVVQIDHQTKIEIICWIISVLLSIHGQNEWKRHQPIITAPSYVYRALLIWYNRRSLRKIWMARNGAFETPESSVSIWSTWRHNCRHRKCLSLVQRHRGECSALLWTGLHGM